MKRICYYLSALILATAPAPIARGEGVELQLRLEHPSVLQYEPVLAFVTIVNNTTKVFMINEENRDKVSIELVVTRDTGETMARINSKLLGDKLYILSDEKEEIMVEASQWYDMREKGRYLITAKVNWNGRISLSNQQMVDVVTGLEIARTEKSVPGYPDRVRTYALKYWTRNSREYLFLVAEDEANRLNFGVFPLGPVVRVFKPTVTVDRAGNVRIVHQSGNDCYVHSLFKSDREGVKFIDHTYRRQSGEPYAKEPPVAAPAQK